MATGTHSGENKLRVERGHSVNVQVMRIDANVSSLNMNVADEKVFISNIP